MKEKKAKLKLEDIKVESFVTSLTDNNPDRIKGAGMMTGDGCPSHFVTWCNDYTCGCPYTWNTCATSPHMNCCVEGD
jgi:hypothetical protein